MILNVLMMNFKRIIVLLLATSVVACTTNPMTGRRSIQLKNNGEIATMAAAQYKQTLSKAKVIKGTAASRQVKKVGMNIKSAAERYYQSIGRAKDLASYQWEFNLIESKQLNAWCMPGGKVAVYTGILPTTKTETGLAVVMGHEVAHALAGHGNERMSQAAMAQYGGAIIGGSISNQQWSQLFSKLYPSVAGVGLLAYGRKQELEADQMGLYLMGMAGYNPKEAVSFWGRMAKASGGGKRTPEFLSTHPSPGNRITQLNAHMPKALQYYQQSKNKK